MKPVVLVTAIGTVTATAIVTELKKTEDEKIDYIGGRILFDRC